MTETDASHPESQSGAAPEGKYLTFTLDREGYGVPIVKIKEIVELLPITQVGNMPFYAKGVINLRGEVIPIVDLRLRLGLKEALPGDRTCIVVVEVEEKGAKRQVGMLVDSVSEVLHIKSKEIEEHLPWRTHLKNSYVLGLAKTANRRKILLDVDHVLGGQSWSA